MRCALDLKRASISPVSSKKVSLEGQVSVVKLLELGLEDLEITVDQDVHWPVKVGDHSTPIIDGVLVLYDVKDQGSIACIPALLSESLGYKQCSLPNTIRKRWESIEGIMGMMGQR